MRYYASWIARFISVDPLQFEYPIYTPFQYAGNKPVSYIDLDGAEELITIYSPYATEKWQKEFGNNPKNSEVKRLLKGARKLENKYFEDKHIVTKMYPKNKFAYDHFVNENEVHVATGWTGELGKFEDSGGLLIQGYNKKGNLVDIYQSKDYERSLKLLKQKRKDDLQYKREHTPFKDRDPLDGSHGFHNGGKQLALGVVGFWFGAYELYAIGTVGFAGWKLVEAIWVGATMVNEVDNIMGVIIYKGGNSFLVEIADNKQVKLNIQWSKTAIDGIDIAKDLHSVITNKKVSEKIFNMAATADDGASLHLDYETLNSLQNGK